MFRRLKEKLSEEVSKSPLRLQSSVQSLGQLSPFKDSEVKNDSNSETSKDSEATNSSVQNLIDLQEGNSSYLDASESKQFSIADEDVTVSAPTSPSAKANEFTNIDLSEKDVGLLNVSTSYQQAPVQMKSPSLSNFSFPVYNPSAPVYHIQSDLESASEVEDSGIHLDNVSKDRLFQAFQTAKSRYQSYKGRYSNAVKAYKEQVDEISKIKVVLAETQDRAFRRISELKEQSQLDQKAKAHLEDTYRVNLEEKDQLISVLHTQIRLLKNGEVKETNVEQPLIDIESHGDVVVGNSESEEDLRLKIKRYEETVSRLKGFLRSCKDTITKNRDITTRLNAEKEDIKKQFENAIVRLSELEQKFSQKELNLRAINNDAHDEINRLKKNEVERGLQLAEFKKTMHDEMNGKEKEIDGLKIQLKEMMSNNEDLRKTIEMKSKQISELETSKNAAPNVMQSLEQMEKCSEEEKQSLLQEMSRSKTAALELMQQQFQRELKDLQREHDELMNKLEMEWQDRFRTKVEELEQQINEENASKKSFEDLLKKAKSECEELSSLKDQLKEYETQVLELKNSKIECQELQDNYKTKVKELESQLSAEILCKKSVEEALNEVKSECAGMDSLKEEVKKLSNILQDCENDNEELKKKNSECLELQSQLNTKVEELQHQLQDEIFLKKTLEDLLQGARAECEESSSLKELLKKLETQLSEREDICDQLEKRNSECLELQCQLTTKVEELQLQISDEISSKKTLEELLMIAQTQCQELDRIKEDRKLLEDQLLERENDCKELEKVKFELSDLQTKYEDGQKSMHESVERFEALQIHLQETELIFENERSNFNRLKEAFEREREGQQQAGEVELEQLKILLEDERRKLNKVNVKRNQLKQTHEKELQEVRQHLTLELDNAKNIFHNTKAEFELIKSQLESTISDQKQEISILKNDFEAVKVENETHKSRIEQLDKQFDDAKLRLEQLQEALRVLSEERNQLQFKFDEHLQSSEELELKMKEDHNRQLLNLKNKTKESFDAMKNQLLELNEQLESEKLAFKTMSIDCEKEIKNFENLLTLERNRSMESERKLSELQNNLTELSSSKENGQLEQMRLINKVDCLQKNLSIAETDLSKCQVERDSAKSTCKDLEIQLSEIRSAVLETEKRLSSLCLEKLNLETVHDGILAALNCDDEGERMTKLEELKSSILSQKLKNIFESCRSCINQMQCDLNNANCRIEDDSVAHQEQISQLEAQKVGFLSEMQSMQTELNKIKDENVDLKMHIDELKSEITSRQQEIRSLQDQNCNIGELEGRVKFDEETIQQLNDDVKKLQDECNARCLELERCQQLERDLNEEVSNLKMEKSSWIDEFDQQKSRFDLQLKETTDNCEQMWQAKIDSLNEDNQTKLNELKKRAENKLAQIKKQMIAESDRVREELSNRIAELEQQKNDNEARCQGTLKRLEDDTITISKLTQQLESLQQTHEYEVQSLTTSFKTSKLEFDQEKGRLLADIEIKNSQLDESLITAQTNCTTMELEMNTLRAEFDAAKLSWKERESELELTLSSLKANQLEAAASDVLKQQHQTELDELKNKYEHLLKDKEDECNSRVKTVIEESTKMIALREEEGRQTLADTIESNMDEDNRLRKEYEQRFIELQQELIEREKSIEQLIEDKQLAFEEKNNEMLLSAKKFEDQITELKNEHHNALDALDKKLRAVMERELKYQSRSHEEELKGLTEEWNQERKLLTEADLNSMAEIDIVQEELQHQADLATSVVESGVQSSDLLQRQIRMLQSQIETLKEQHKNEVEELHHVLKMSSHPVPPNLNQKAQFNDHQLQTLELEYLRNILFEYMMGRETLVLAKVIAAVLKFDDNQTRKILEKEEIRTGGVTGPLVQLLK